MHRHAHACRVWVRLRSSPQGTTLEIEDDGRGFSLQRLAEPGVLGLALLVFLWTPIHFWSLALVYREDYARAGVPILPATPRRTALWGLLRGTGAGALSLALHPSLGLPYLLPALGGTLLLLGQGARLVQEPSRRRALSLFHTSNLYLALLLLALWADTLLP